MAMFKEFPLRSEKSTLREMTPWILKYPMREPIPPWVEDAYSYLLLSFFSLGVSPWGMGSEILAIKFTCEALRHPQQHAWVTEYLAWFKANQKRKVKSTILRFEKVTHREMDRMDRDDS